ncbi:hypothetical protein CsSME_00047851 [Camellia sinensis var. sinensis]
MDAFALPVEGTETRVNAQADAYEYMVDYSQTNEQVGRLENVVGWYHSHPGYGCWLSSILMSQHKCSTSNFKSHFWWSLLIQQGLFQLEKSRLVHSKHTQKDISLQMSLFLSIKPSL